MTRQPIAAVTGASRGIGRAVVLELARSGYSVFALARTQEDLMQLARSAQEGGLDVHPLQCDVSDDASRNEAVASIFTATGGYGVDVLVNNAGFGQFGPLEEIPIDKFRRQLEVNLTAVLAFTQPFLPQMRARRRGWIVNISSAAGRTATPFMGAYNASKFGLEGMSDALRLELHPFHVRVILIAPGPIRTDFGHEAARVTEERSDSPYGEYVQHWQCSRRKSNIASRSPETVARIVRRAVRSPRPRPRYTITATARLGAIGRRLVPDTMMDLILRRVMGLP